MSQHFHFLVALLFLLGPKSPAPAQQSKEGPKENRADQYGDPLPEGAVARLGTGRLCQPDVYLLAFSPDGTKLVTVAGGGVLRVWDVGTGKEVRRWQVPNDSPYYSPHSSPLAFSPDGRHLALACPDKCLRVWEVATAKEVLKQGQDFIAAVAFSPDGQALATASGNRVCLYDPPSGRLLIQLEGCSHLKHVAFSGDGKTVVAVGHEKPDRKEFRLHRWDVATGKEQGNHAFEFFSRFSSRLSPDGQFLVVPDMKGTALRRWDTATGKELAPAEAEGSYPALIAFAGDGRALTTLSRDGRLRVWESATGKLLHQFAGRAGELERVALSADGKALAATTRGDQGIHLWDVARGKELLTFLGHRNGPLAVTFAPDGRSVLTASRDPGFSSPPRAGADWSLRRWDFRTGKETRVWRQDQETEVRHAVFSPGGRFLATANSAGLLRLLDAVNGKEETTWQLPTQETTIRSGDDVKKHPSLAIIDLVLSPDGAAVAASGWGKITLWERATGKKLREIARPAESVTRCCFFPDGKSLLVADWGSTKYPLTQVDAQTGAELRRFPGVNDWAHTLGVAPSGRTVAMIARTELRVYEVLTGRERCTLDLGCWSSALAFSPDGRLLVTGGRNAVVRLWDPAAGRAIHQLAGHDGEVSSLAFSPDGRWLVSGGGNTALVWDVQALLQEKRPAPPKLAGADLEDLWRGLGSANPRDSAPALGRLAQGGEAAATFLHKQLAKPPQFPAEKIDQWVADLDSDEFAVREKASRELEKAASLAEPALKKALAKSPSLEAKRRIQALLEKVAGPPAAWLQGHRALEALELIGDGAARQALQRLAKEAPEDWIRREADLALRRLERRP